MRHVYDIPASNLAKAQDILGKDDLVSRQSTYTRTAASLGLNEDKTYLILDGSEEALTKAETLLKGMAQKVKDQASILKKFDEIENASAQGFGFLGI